MYLSTKVARVRRINNSQWAFAAGSVRVHGTQKVSEAFGTATKVTNAQNLLQMPLV